MTPLLIGMYAVSAGMSANDAAMWLKQCGHRLHVVQSGCALLLTDPQLVKGNCCSCEVSTGMPGQVHDADSVSKLVSSMVTRITSDTSVLDMCKIFMQVTYISHILNFMYAC